MRTKKGRSVYWIAGLSALMLTGSVAVLTSQAQAKNAAAAKEAAKITLKAYRAMPTVFSSCRLGP